MVLRTVTFLLVPRDTRRTSLTLAAHVTPRMSAFVRGHIKCFKSIRLQAASNSCKRPRILQPEAARPQMLCFSQPVAKRNCGLLSLPKIRCAHFRC